MPQQAHISEEEVGEFYDHLYGHMKQYRQSKIDVIIEDSTV